MREYKRVKLIVALLLDFLFLCFLVFGERLSTYMLNDLSDCLYYKVLGIKCLTCGGTHCVNALLRGNISEAFAYNSYVPIFILFFIFYLFLTNSGWIFGVSWSRKVISKMNSTSFVLTMTGICFGYIILRNVFSFIP